MTQGCWIGRVCRRPCGPGGYLGSVQKGSDIYSGHGKVGLFGPVKHCGGVKSTRATSVGDMTLEINKLEDSGSDIFYEFQDNPDQVLNQFRAVSAPRAASATVTPNKETLLTRPGFQFDGGRGAKVHMSRDCRCIKGNTVSNVDITSTTIWCKTCIKSAPKSPLATIKEEPKDAELPPLSVATPTEMGFQIAGAPRAKVHKLDSCRWIEGKSVFNVNITNTTGWCKTCTKSAPKSPLATIKEEPKDAELPPPFEATPTQMGF
ncbi:hypothetical protein SARC_01436 [Sphaeroforma arctica JP610]|uniref:Uncharacterized protein n=1 Tax=Sphaeroforma arctica JP610 TaxID=667725 RepID=A0A0L0GBQ5_9EUKA|nr:hypothetical protein SARC_01436 [Sphaeroforma arctica JP610]KNC86430.1 hypothetical protein SARC_01436 [Sphaeroforma arctica JP610]|eukprot:XP_014160332.1 hypothetical protein SARC_01436 [Sphaeroforma arctica JP610]